MYNHHHDQRSEMRNFERNGLSFNFEVRDNLGEESEAELFNLSSTGFLARLEFRPVVDDIIFVRLPQLDWTAAKVKWAEQNLAGCSFDEVLPKRALSAAFLRSKTDGKLYCEGRFTTETNHVAIEHPVELANDKYPINIRFWIIVGAAALAWAVIGGLGTLMV